MAAFRRADADRPHVEGRDTWVLCGHHWLIEQWACAFFAPRDRLRQDPVAYGHLQEVGRKNGPGVG